MYASPCGSDKGLPYKDRENKIWLKIDKKIKKVKSKLRENKIKRILKKPLD